MKEEQQVLPGNLIGESTNYGKVKSIVPDRNGFGWVNTEDGSQYFILLNTLTKPTPSSLDRSAERVWDEEMNRWVERPNKTIEEKLDRSVSQPGKEESKSEQLKNMLEDVINELDLSDGMIEKHGPIGTPPAELVRLVLARKDLEFKMLKTGFKHIDPQPSQSGEGEGDLTAAYTRQIYKLKCEIDSLNRELTALKSRPSDGWSDERVIELMEWIGKAGYENYTTWDQWIKRPGFPIMTKSLLDIYKSKS